MYCIKCGAQLPPDSQFCTSCGTKLDNSTTPEVPNVGPIAPSPTGQPFTYGQPPKKKSKALLWALIGVGAALIAAAVLIFVVFKPGAGPFSGNTVQTRFANDVVGVFTGAASGLETENDMKKIMNQPFELTMTTSTDASGIKTGTDIAYAYDELALGVSSSSTTDYSGSEFADILGDSAALDGTMKLLLLEDTLYIEQDGTVNGIRFNSKSDLSKPMPLKDRIAALFESSKLANIDYLQLTEMFLNSIDESCFDKNAGETTLTLDGDALSDTLRTFADKLEENDKLNDAITDMIEEISGYPIELSGAISMAAPMLKDADFELTFSVSYKDSRPAGLDIVLSSAGSMVFDASFEYENQKDGKLLTLDVSTPDGPALSMACDITKTADGIDFDGSITIPGSDTITFNGPEVMDNSSASVTVEMSAGDQKMVMTVDQTVIIGKPSEAVEDDSRFAMDTGSANVIDFNDIFSGGLNGGLTEPALTD